MQLIMTKGLPASGKTTWAKKEVIASKGKTKRVNKDDLRAMIDAGEWSKDKEKDILKVRDNLVMHYLLNGYSVIVDDTNLHPKHELALKEIARDFGAEFEVKSFTNVPLQTCIDRDSARPNSVGRKVITGMHRTFLKGEYNPYLKPPYNEDLPSCIIVDIDGTLAHMTGRSPFDYTQVSTDVVDENVADIVRKYAAHDVIPDTYIVIVSGRDVTCLGDTTQWLADNNIPYDEIYMRDPNLVDEKGNKLDDTVIKKNIYEELIKPRFNVRFVLDDRDRVVKMWREQGLKVLQVAEGDF